MLGKDHLHVDALGIHLAAAGLGIRERDALDRIGLARLERGGAAVVRGGPTNPRGALASRLRVHHVVDEPGEAGAEIEHARAPIGESGVPVGIGEGGGGLDHVSVGVDDWHGGCPIRG
jgi:hypothetical protein